MRIFTGRGVRPANYGEGYTNKESTLIIKMRDDFAGVARLLGRTEKSVVSQYGKLALMAGEERWIQGLLDNAPLFFRGAEALYSQIKREFPRVSAAQGKQNGKHFVSVAYTSPGGVKIDEALHTTGEWPALRERILQVYEVAA